MKQKNIFNPKIEHRPTNRVVGGSVPYKSLPVKMAKEVESLVGAAAGDGGGNEYLYSQQEQNALGGMHQDSSQHTRRHNM